MSMLTSLWRHSARVLFLLLAALIITGCAFRKHIDQGDMYFGQGQYEKALAEYEAALRIDPGAEEAVIKARNAREKLAGEWTGEATAKLEAGDYDGAITIAGKAYDLTPENEEIQDLVSHVATTSADHADTTIETQQFGAGNAIYVAIDAKLPPEHAKTKGRYEAFKQSWAAYLSEQGEVAENEGRHGEALLLWSKAAQLSADPRFRQKRDALRKELRDVYAYRVQLKGSKSDARFQDFSGRLLRFSAPQNIYVIEPGEKASDIHAVYTFEVGDPKLREDVTTSNTTEKYQAGTRKIPNPEYNTLNETIANAEAELTTQEQLLAEAQRNLTRAEEAAKNDDPNDGITTDAERNLQNHIDAFNAQQEVVVQAQNTLNQAVERRKVTPSQIDEPIYKDHTYAVKTYTVNGSIPLRGEILHKDGRNAMTFTKVATINHTDTTHDAQSVLGLAADPLELPSRQAMNAELENAAFDNTVAQMLESFADYRATLLTQAFSSDADVKVDILTLYILLDPSNVDPSVPTELERLRDISDPVEILTAP